MDRRVQRTKSKLNESLLILMKEKNINKITVKELSELSDINRKTFYLHYCDIFDMVDNIKNMLLTDFENVLLSHTTPCSNTNEPYLLLKEILEFVDRNSEILSIFLGPHVNADSIFIEKMKDMMKNLSINVWNIIYPNATAKNYDYFYSFAFYGFIGLIQDWINNNKEESIETMAKLTSEIIVKSSPILNY